MLRRPEAQEIGSNVANGVFRRVAARALQVALNPSNNGGSRTENKGDLTAVTA